MKMSKLEKAEQAYQNDIARVAKAVEDGKINERQAEFLKKHIENAHKEAIEEILKPQVYALTFEEIKKLYEHTQVVIKNNDYGFVPAMLIKFEGDKGCEEKNYISTTSLNEITKVALGDKKAEDIPWVDITDETKFDFI
jgi:hypothetical protein